MKTNAHILSLAPTAMAVLRLVSADREKTSLSHTPEHVLLENLQLKTVLWETENYNFLLCDTFLTQTQWFREVWNGEETHVAFRCKGIQKTAKLDRNMNTAKQHGISVWVWVLVSGISGKEKLNYYQKKTIT